MDDILGPVLPPHRQLMERIDRQHAEVLEVLRLLTDAQFKMTEGLDRFLAMLEQGAEKLDTSEPPEATDET